VSLFSLNIFYFPPEETFLLKKRENKRKRGREPFLGKKKVAIESFMISEGEALFSEKKVGTKEDERGIEKGAKLNSWRHAIKLGKSESSFLFIHSWVRHSVQNGGKSEGEKSGEKKLRPKNPTI